MPVRPRTRNRSFLTLLVVVGTVLTLASPSPSRAVETGSGSVTVTGTNNAKISITIDDASAAFGSTLAPDGTNSNSTDTVLDYQGSSGNQGSYYVWKSAGSGLALTVKSNQTWNGTVYATENSGTAASLTVASGALRYGTSEPTSYAAGASLTAFSAVTTTAWVGPVAKGVNAYTYFYGLRVDWNDDPGTFASTVTYGVSQ